MIKVYKDLQPVDILAIGIHPDDVELSASGTLLSHMDQGYRVGICDLTRGELGSRGTAETREQEARHAAEILGVDWRVNLLMADGFSMVDRDHLIRLIEVIRLARPKIILANALEDRHPDHSKGAKLAKEAFFLSGLKKITNTSGQPHRADNLYHYIQDKQLIPDICVDISNHIDRKMEAIRAYKTQFFQGSDIDDHEAQTPISTKAFTDFMLGKMRVFGRPIQADYAEGYNIHREIGVDNLMSLR